MSLSLSESVLSVTQQWFDFPGGSEDKVYAYNEGDPGSIPGSGRSPGEGNGNPLQFAWKIPRTKEHCQLQSMGVAKSRTRLSNFTFTLALFGICLPGSSHTWRLADTRQCICTLCNRKEKVDSFEGFPNIHCLQFRTVVTVISGWERAGSVLSREKQGMPSLLAEEADSRHWRASQESHGCGSLKGHAPGFPLLVQVTRSHIKPWHQGQGSLGSKSERNSELWNARARRDFWLRFSQHLFSVTDIHPAPGQVTYRH